MRDLLTLSRSILLGLRRDKVGLFFTILFPLIFLLVMGGLFRTDGTPKVTVVEVGAVEVLDTLPADARAQLDPVLTIEHGDDPAAALAKVRDGDAAAMVEQRGDEVVLHYSAADKASSGTVRSVLTSVVQSANLTATGVPPRLSLSSTQVEDTSLKQIQYLTPGILGWAIAMGATFGASATLVGWRQRRLLRRLSLCPIDMGSVVRARLLVSLGVALVQTVLFLAVATLFFGLRLSGSWWLTVPLVLAGALAFLSIGLLAGAKAKSGETANAISNLIVIPMAFLSGSFFPLSMAPDWLRVVSQALPLRHLNDGMLDVLARGAGVLHVLPQFGMLLAFAAVVTFIATRMLSWDDV